ncbi:MAG: MTH1187 family thiamine-binding protein [Chloroflexi bacterium]|nr:MTH1187 family thiamine-binding protein [Chloroflexota bacterium]
MSRTVTVSVQVVPLVEDSYPVVDKAIAAIAATGIKYMVTPMETVLEGTLDDCLEAVKAAHHACFEGGAQKALTFVKISDSTEGSTIDDKLAKYR